MLKFFVFLFFMNVCVVFGTVNDSVSIDKTESSYGLSEVDEDSPNRVQKVLNAFQEVSGVLAEVPRQILLLPIRFGFFPGVKVKLYVKEKYKFLFN